MVHQTTDYLDGARIMNDQINNLSLQPIVEPGPFNCRVCGQPCSVQFSRGQCRECALDGHGELLIAIAKAMLDELDTDDDKQAVLWELDRLVIGDE